MHDLWVVVDGSAKHARFMILTEFNSIQFEKFSTSCSLLFLGGKIQFLFKGKFLVSQEFSIQKSTGRE